MKKVIVILAVVLSGLNLKSFAQCENDLPVQLQLCFDSYPLALTVTVAGTDALIDGTLASTLDYTNMQACITQYNIDAETCPAAPSIVMGSITSTVIGNSNDSPSASDTGNPTNNRAAAPGKRK